MSFEECCFYSAALSAAFDYADLSCDEAYCTFVSKKDDYYIIAFRTDFLKYECYVDFGSLEVLGFNFEPIADMDDPERRLCGELRQCRADIPAANG